MHIYIILYTYNTMCIYIYIYICVYIYIMYIIYMCMCFYGRLCVFMSFSSVSSGSFCAEESFPVNHPGLRFPLVGDMFGWWFQTFFIFHNIWDNPSHLTNSFQDG